MLILNCAPGPLAQLSPLANGLGTDLLRVTVYGNMPDIVRRRFSFRWTHADRAAFVAVCSAIRAMEPAIRRGALDRMFPEGTPHLDPSDPTKVVVAGPNPRQQARRAPAA